MKIFTLFLITLFYSFQSHSQNKGTFSDPRDGQQYTWIKIGDQTWMGENLNYDAPDSLIYQFGSKNCLNNEEAKCKVNGRYYDFTSAQKVCPAGWHLPDRNEWMTLAKQFGEATETSKENYMTLYGSNQGQALKEGGSSGFEAKLSGSRKFLKSMQSGTDVFANAGDEGIFWTSTEDYDAGFAFNITKDRNDFGISRNDYDALNNGNSVRCIKD